MKAFVLFMLLIIITANNDPGIRMGLSNNGVRNMLNFIIPQIAEKSLPMNGFAISKHLDFIGTVFVNITNPVLKINSFDSKNTDIKFYEKDEKVILDMDLKDLTGKIYFDYDFKSNFYNNKDSGYVLLTGTGLKIINSLFMLANKVDVEKFGPGVQINKIDLQQVNMDIEFNNLGNLEKIFVYLVKALNESFNKMIKQQLTQEKIDNINTMLLELLSNTKLITQVQGIGLDYSLTERPKIVSDNLQISLNSTVYSDTTGFYGPSHSIPDFSTATKYININIDEFVFDNSFKVLQDKKLLKQYIPGETSSLLTTDYMETIISGMIDKYGKKRIVDLNLACSSPPDMKFADRKISFIAQILTGLVVNKEDLTKEEAVLLDIGIVGNVDLTIMNGYVKGKFNEITVSDIKVVSKRIDKDIDPKNLIFGFNFILKNSLDTINYKVFGKDGIKIPDLFGINFDHSELTVQNGYLSIGIQSDKLKNDKIFLE